MTVLLHGFWGQPGDWNPVLERLPLSAPVWAPDLYEAGTLSPQNDLQTWTGNFLEALHDHAGHKPVQIVGYSMGGRLALHALLAAPQMFRRALLLSASPSVSAAVREERANWEKTWANRFLSEEWSTLETDWSEQAVFSGCKPVARRRTPHIREMLGLSLTRWSPQGHRFTDKDLKTLPATVDWAFGASDQKYVGVAKQLQDLPLAGQIKVIPNAGHRLVADAPDFISQWITRGG